MGKVDLQNVQKLRERSGMGMMDCKKALEEAHGDMEKAVSLLRKKGADVAAKRGENDTNEGLVHAYIHPGGRVGVLLQLNCETDFVALNQDFKQFASDLCMHIAAVNPLYLNALQADQNWIEQEKNIIKEQLKESGKPSAMIDKIVDGKTKKLLSEVCLLDQPFVKNDKLSVEEVLKELVGKVGENIKITRFTRYELGN